MAVVLFSVAFAPTPAEAMRAEGLTAEQCVPYYKACTAWYASKIEEDEDFAPERAFEKCVTSGAGTVTNWRGLCPSDQMDNLKRELKLIQVRKIDPQFDADGKFMVHVKFTSLQDCKTKWNKQLNVPESTSVFAGFKDNVDAETICKRLYPNSSIRACPLPERCEPTANGCYWTGPQPNASGVCPDTCGEKICNKQDDPGSGNNGGGGGEGGN